VFGVVLELTEGQALLMVDLPETWAHIAHHVDFGRDFSLGCPSLGKEGPHLWTVEIYVVVGRMCETIDEESRRVVEVVGVREASLLELA